MQKLYKMKKPEAASVQKAVGDYLLKIDNVNGNTPSSISPTNSVGSQVCISISFLKYKILKSLIF